MGQLRVNNVSEDSILVLAPCQVVLNSQLLQFQVIQHFLWPSVVLYSSIHICATHTHTYIHTIESNEKIKRNVRET